MNSWRSTGQHKISGFGLWISSTPQNQRKGFFSPDPTPRNCESPDFDPPQCDPRTPEERCLETPDPEKKFFPGSGGSLLWTRQIQRFPGPARLHQHRRAQPAVQGPLCREKLEDSTQHSNMLSYALSSA